MNKKPYLLVVLALGCGDIDVATQNTTDWKAYQRICTLYAPLDSFYLSTPVSTEMENLLEGAQLTSCRAGDRCQLAEIREEHCSSDTSELHCYLVESSDGTRSLRIEAEIPNQAPPPSAGDTWVTTLVAADGTVLINRQDTVAYEEWYPNGYPECGIAYSAYVCVPGASCWQHL